MACYFNFRAMALVISSNSSMMSSSISRPAARMARMGSRRKYSELPGELLIHFCSAASVSSSCVISLSGCAEALWCP